MTTQKIKIVDEGKGAIVTENWTVKESSRDRTRGQNIYRFLVLGLFLVGLFFSPIFFFGNTPEAKQAELRRAQFEQEIFERSQMRREEQVRVETEPLPPPLEGLERFGGNKQPNSDSFSGQVFEFAQNYTLAGIIIRAIWPNVEKEAIKNGLFELGDMGQRVRENKRPRRFGLTLEEEKKK